MPASKDTIDILHAFVFSADRLKRLELPDDVLNPLIDLASLATLRQQLGENRPAFVGFIGCTGTGKSTLFNSFIGQEISLTDWKVHNTCGPVLFMPERVLKRISQWETKFGPLLLPTLKREILSIENDADSIFENLTQGSPDTLYIVSRTDEKSKHAPFSEKESLVLIDLPDINSSPALDENLIALKVLPWLDVIIFMVDDETIFHRVYERPVWLADELEQPRFCVLSNRGRDQVDLEHPDMKQTTAFFGVDEIHVLPELKANPFFESEPAFTRFRQAIETYHKLSPPKPLLKKIAKLARMAVENNRKRLLAFRSLEEKISQMIATGLVQDRPVSLEKILHDEVLQALSHLGLKRLAVSNLLHFFKAVVSSGSLKHGFKLSFGDRRDKILAPKLRFDREKLGREVSKRLADHRESILVAVRSHPDMDIIREVEPVLNNMIVSDLHSKAANDTSNSLQQEIQNTIERFEKACTDLLASDSVAKVIQNDPMLAAALVAAFVVDVFGFHGFLGWLLVPTVFRYLPIGKFETIKKNFQDEVQNLIRKQLLRVTQELQDIRVRTVLEDKDPLMQSLEMCAQYD